MRVPRSLDVCEGRSPVLKEMNLSQIYEYIYSIFALLRELLGKGLALNNHNFSSVFSL